MFEAETRYPNSQFISFKASLASNACKGCITSMSKVP